MTTGDDNTVDITQNGSSNTIGDTLVADIRGNDNDITITQKAMSTVQSSKYGAIAMMLT